jgi:hypothetical protein
MVVETPAAIKPYSNGLYHKGFNCLLHVGAFVTVCGAKTVSRNLTTGQREIVKEDPDYVGKIISILPNGEIMVRPYELMFDNKGLPTYDTGDIRISPVSDFPGSTLTEIVEIHMGELHRVSSSKMIIGLPFVFSPDDLVDPNISWISGMTNAFLLRYRFCSSASPVHGFPFGFSIVECHEAFVCDAHNDMYMPCSSKTVFLGLQAMYDTIQRALNTIRGSQGDFKKISDRSRFHHNLAWKLFSKKCSDVGIQSTPSKFGYLKVLNLPGFVTKKVKISRSATVFLFNTQEHIEFLQSTL